MKTNDKTVLQIAKRAYPEYRGRKFFFEAQRFPLDVRSYWDGGSRDYYRFLRLEDMSCVEVPPQSAFDKTIAGAESIIVPVGFVCVRRHIFMGRESGLTVIANPDNVSKLLGQSE